MRDPKPNIQFRAMTSEEQKLLANGMRDTSKKPLTDEEIEFVKSEIKRIHADESVFVFNDTKHIHNGTCYNFEEDKIYVTRNVFPDLRYPSAHPRDTMSVGAVLAHEYYGHRAFRAEYLDDLKKGPSFHTMPLWRDECRASLWAAQTAPGLTQIDRRDLVLDAVFRAKEYGQLIPMDEFMKEALYGYTKNERSIATEFREPKYVSEKSQEGHISDRGNGGAMPKMPHRPNRRNDPER
jgi:hypothetical protein